MPHFDGPEYDPHYDLRRLTTQHARVRTLMADGEWRTLEEIGEATGDPVSSISAQLRHLRKERFGSNTVLRRPSPTISRYRGLFEYRLVLNETSEPEYNMDIEDLLE